IRCTLFVFVFVFFFFFSSRRRHTRSKRDWSSDVCSSDLSRPGRERADLVFPQERPHHWQAVEHFREYVVVPRPGGCLGVVLGEQIGRASCRERVWISGGAGSVKRKEEERWERK